MQRNLGATRAAASDVGAACVGFLYALHLADGLIQSGKAQNVLVIGGEILSRYVDWTDRNTCVLFGDGAGAVLLQATKGDHGILGSIMKSNGAYHDFICMPGGGSDHPANDPKSIEQRLPYIKMKGNETFKVAVKAMADVSTELLTEQGFTQEQVEPLHPPPGQPAHHRRGRRAAQDRPDQGLQERGPLRQHVRGLDPDRAGRVACARDGSRTATWS